MENNTQGAVLTSIEPVNDPLVSFLALQLPTSNRASFGRASFGKTAHTLGSRPRVELFPETL
jgi:hypothetical protein